MGGIVGDRGFRRGSGPASVSNSSPPRLGITTKLAFGSVIWLEYVRVIREVHRTSLPQLVQRLQDQPHHIPLPRIDPLLLGRIVSRTLRRHPFRPRCLTMSLVHFRLLTRQGTGAQLIVGLPLEPSSHEAHAWVEVGGLDVGPPPGRMGHEEMARYGGVDPSKP